MTPPTLPPNAAQPTPGEDSGATPAPRSPLARVLQVVGFFVGLGLLAACAYLAMRNPEHRAQLARLADAPWPNLLGLLALSAATVSVAGLTFAAVLRPVRRISRLDCVAVNSVCSTLSYLPFKMSLVFRVLYHHRRDGLPIMVIGGWIAATALVIMAALGPVVLASLWRGQVDGPWWAAATGGILLAGSALLVVARFLASERGWATLERLAAATRLGLVRRAVASRWFSNLHQGVHMLASPRAVSEALALRALDLAIHSARFYLAAVTIGVDLSPGQAVLAGAVYFFLQGAAPTGVAGVREAGTVGALGLLQSENLLVVVLAVSAAEGAVNLLMGAAGAAWLRVDRLFAGRSFPPAISA